MSDNSGKIMIEKAFNESLNNKSTGKKVFDTIVNTKVNKKIEERVSLLEKGFEIQEKLIKEIEDIKPDNEGVVSEDGVVSPRTYSKSLYKKKQDLISNRKAIDEAMKKCLDNHLEEDYNKLKKLLK